MLVNLFILRKQDTSSGSYLLGNREKKDLIS